MASNNEPIFLFDAGLLVQVQISFWGMRKMLTTDDFIRMNVDPSRFPTDLVNLGQKLLVPKEERRAFVNYDSRARTFLRRWSVPFGIQSTYFVPTPKVDEVKRRLDEIKAEFDTQVESFVYRFAAIKKQMEQHPQYSEFWSKCLRHAYPKDAADLRSRFRFRYLFFRISGGLTEADASKEVARDAEFRKQMQTEVSDFVESYVSTMRAETVEFCKMLTARIRGEKYGYDKEPKELTPKALKALAGHVQWFREMNIFGDQEIERMLKEVADKFASGQLTQEQVDDGHFKFELVQALKAIREKASEEGEARDKFIGALKRKVRI